MTTRHTVRVIRTTEGVHTIPVRILPHCTAYERRRQERTLRYRIGFLIVTLDSILDWVDAHATPERVVIVLLVLGLIVSWTIH